MPSTTSFDGVNLHYRCPYCEYTRSELADPDKNRAPFFFLGASCRGCGRYLEIDQDVVEQAQATFSTPRSRS